MSTEKEKMLGGELYDPLDPQLSAERRRARLLVKRLNDTRDDQQDERARLIRELIPATGAGVEIEPFEMRQERTCRVEEDRELSQARRFT